MSTSISIVLRVDQIHKTNGKAPIILRFNHNRKKKDISLDRFLYPKESIKKIDLSKLNSEERLQLYNWDNKASEVTKGETNYSRLNQLLTKKKNRAVQIILDYETFGKELTGELFKKEFKNDKGINISAYSYFTKELKSREENYSDETYKSYSTILSKLNNYKPNLELKEINNKFLCDYENYMLKSIAEGGKGNTKRTAANNMKVIKTFINIAIANKAIPKGINPFEDFKIKKYKGESKRKFIEPHELVELEKLLKNYKPLKKPMEDLSPEEWKIREKKGLLTPSEYNVLLYFLFSCYTGLRFQDVKDIEYIHIKSKLVRKGDSLSFEKKPCIEIDMHKTGFPVMIPLLKKAQKMLDQRKKEGKIFKVISNQNTNKTLKRIMEFARIEKKITYHCSRHTFGSIALMYRIPQKVVQSILGHQNSETTEIYSHVADDFIFNQMEEFERRLSEQEESNSQSKRLPTRGDKRKDELMGKLISMPQEELEKLMRLKEALG